MAGRGVLFFLIPSPPGNGMHQRIRSITGGVDLVPFDRGFYSKELIIPLQDLKIPYLTFVPKNRSVKRELEFMSYNEKRIIGHDFSFYRNGKKTTGDTYLAFLKKIYDRRTGEYSDWIFATNLETIDLDSIMMHYKMRTIIEIMFRVRDECRIRTESKHKEVIFLFTYEQLVESVWYLFYHEEVSFKRFLIELSSVAAR